MGNYANSMQGLKEELIKTGIKQSLIVELLGIHQSDLSTYFSLDRVPTPEIKTKIELIITHYKKALTQIKTQL